MLLKMRTSVLCKIKETLHKTFTETVKSWVKKPCYKKPDFKTAFARCRHNLKTIENSTNSVKSLQEFDVKEMYQLLKNRFASFEKRRTMFHFHHFLVFTRCRFQNLPVEVPFQTLPFSNSAGKICAVFV